MVKEMKALKKLAESIDDPLTALAAQMRSSDDDAVVNDCRYLSLAMKMFKKS